MNEPNDRSEELEVRCLKHEEKQRFEKLLSQHHYLGQTPRVGDFLEQVVERKGEWIALLVWGPAALKLKARERWIGWDRLQQARRLKLIVQNRRYLLLHAKGQEPNLASQVLAAACRSLPTQWEKHFGYRPLLAESFTDPEAYHGTCYKASGWQAVGMSAGNSRHQPDYYLPNQRPKKLWLKELCSGARSLIAAQSLPQQSRAGVIAGPHGILPLSQMIRQSLYEAMRQAPDPRSSNTRFKIGPVLSIVTMALMSGARQISEIARFANRLEPKQRAELRLPIKKGTRRFYQVPNYSVFYQVLSRMDPDEFAKILSRWMIEQQDHLPASVALDGKMIKDIIGTVSLVDVEDGAPIALRIMDQKHETQRCELKAAQELINQIESLEGKTVTADPLHCQKATARAIAEKGGDYFLQIKGNQPTLFDFAKKQVDPSPPLRRPQLGTEGSRSAP